MVALIVGNHHIQWYMISQNSDINTDYFDGIKEWTNGLWTVELVALIVTMNGIK